MLSGCLNELRPFLAGTGRLFPSLALHEAPFRRLPARFQLGKRSSFRKGVTCPDEVLSRLTQLTETHEELASQRLVGYLPHVVGQHLSRSIKPLTRLEEANRRRQRRLVVGCQGGNARPGLARRNGILALLFVDLGDRLFQHDTCFDVFDCGCLLLEELRQFIPTPGALQHATQRREGLLIVRVQLDQLFQRCRRIVEIAKLLLAQ